MGLVVLPRRSRVIIRLMGSVKRTAPGGEEVVFGVGYGHASPSITSQPVPVFPFIAGGKLCQICLAH